MCGIVGRLNFDGRSIDPRVLKAMSQSVVHRGPDDEGHVLLRLGNAPYATTPRFVEYRDPDEIGSGQVEGLNLGLGFRRLSIIDLSSAGHQPMTNEDGTVWIVFNGEFYNSLDYTDELHSKGHRFKSDTDTEVILHLYEEYGIAGALERMHGMFAFALCDLRKGRMFLIRDRVGVKPVYFHLSDRHLIFGSEVKGLFADLDVPRSFDVSRIHELFATRYINAPHTVFQGIRKLRPGTYWEFSTDRPKGVERRYWSYFDGIGSVEPAGEAEYHRALIEAVSERLRSDVPLGVFLSGGLDSSTLSGIVTRDLDPSLETFSVGFSRESAVDESWASREVSNYLGTRHHALPFDPSLIDMMPTIARHCEEPIADPALLPTWVLCEYTRRFVTVALSGEGSDESNYGYERYRLGSAGTFLRALPHALEAPALGLLAPVLKLLGRPLLSRVSAFHSNPLGDADSEVFMSSSRLQRILSPDAFAGSPSRGADWKKRWVARSVFDVQPQVHFHTWLSDDLLLKVDKMSMAHSLEVRVPYLDHNVLAVAASLDARTKLEDGKTKAVLRRLAQAYVPPSISERQQHGFRVPIPQIFTADLAKPGDESAIRRYLEPARDIFSLDAVLAELAPGGKVSRATAAQISLFAMVGLTISEFDLRVG